MAHVGCLELVKSEFKLKNLTFSHHSEKDLYKIKCLCLPLLATFAIRVIFTIYMLVSLIYSLAIVDFSAKWPVFLTNWNIVIVFVYFILLTIVTGIYGLKKEPINNDIEMRIKQSPLNASTNAADDSKIRVQFKIVYLWTSLTYLVTGLVFVMYWSFVTEDEHFDTPERRYSYINDHGVSLVLILIDFCFHDIPVKFLHFVHTWVVAVIYIVVTVVYNFAEGRYVYSVLDWKGKPGSAGVTVVMALVLVLVVQTVFCIMNAVKRKVKA